MNKQPGTRPALQIMQPCHDRKDGKASPYSPMVAAGAVTSTIASDGTRAQMSHQFWRRLQPALLVFRAFRSTPLCSRLPPSHDVHPSKFSRSLGLCRLIRSLCENRMARCQQNDFPPSPTLDNLRGGWSRKLQEILRGKNQNTEDSPRLAASSSKVTSTALAGRWT
jgi:hypothetical protein